jgi:hypothetical protein
MFNGYLIGACRGIVNLAFDTSLFNASSALQELLKIYSYPPEGIPSQPTALSKIENRHGLPSPIPVEIWREIAAYLFRSDLRALLFVPHLRHIALELYFQDIDLHFGVFQPEYDQRYMTTFKCDTLQSTLHTWHLQKSLDLMARMMRDSVFASRVKNIKICACKFGNDNNYDFEIGKY